MREIIMIITIIIIIIPNLVLAQNDNSKYDPSQDVFEFLVNEGYIVAVLLSNSVYLTKGLLGLIALGISRIIEHTRDQKDNVNTMVSKIINAHYYERG
ncbi:hypothetical protein RhiirA5_426848 [Rhizophagus irregularis]|uniref:Uncharacterized protein n=1 Tax=Rhizophagus irregularis TaxID=588596 RepID=A0A2N0P3E5_9GLOM|nr:hypothetical protein RhiirA5_426848 [Rhizophagus irregularis]